MSLICAMVKPRSASGRLAIRTSTSTMRARRRAFTKPMRLARTASAGTATADATFVAARAGSDSASAHPEGHIAQQRQHEQRREQPRRERPEPAQPFGERSIGDAAGNESQWDGQPRNDECAHTERDADGPERQIAQEANADVDMEQREKGGGSEQEAEATHKFHLMTPMRPGYKAALSSEV